MLVFTEIQKKTMEQKRTIETTKTVRIYTGWSKKRHKVNDTIILQPYVIVMWLSAKCSERNSLRD